MERKKEGKEQPLACSLSSPPLSLSLSLSLSLFLARALPLPGSFVCPFVRSFVGWFAAKQRRYYEMYVLWDKACGKVLNGDRGRSFPGEILLNARLTRAFRKAPRFPIPSARLIAEWTSFARRDNRSLRDRLSRIIVVSSAEQSLRINTIVASPQLTSSTRHSPEDSPFRQNVSLFACRLAPIKRGVRGGSTLPDCLFTPD